MDGNYGSSGGRYHYFMGTINGPFRRELSVKRDKDTEEFGLPFYDVSEQLSSQGLYCPGSLVKINLKKGHPLTLGMQNSVGVFYRGSPVFNTSVPAFDMDRRVIAVTPEKNILVSGYIEKEELLGK